MRQSYKPLREPVLTAEHKLWRAVLEQAYTDAELFADCADSGDGPADRIKARFFLRGDSWHEAADLALVCDFAAVPADRLINWARKNYPRPQGLDPQPSRSASSTQAHVRAQQRCAPGPQDVSRGVLAPATTPATTHLHSHARLQPRIRKLHAPHSPSLSA